MELYKRYRPKTLKAVLGQEGAIASLQKLIDKNRIPHALMFTGPSGCGKTTVGRILKDILECGDSDFVEVNAASSKGIDMIRSIGQHSNMSPMDGECRIWLIDEAHKLTSDAQHAFLKLLEDTPDHVYLMLATTDPQKLLKTIHTRCTEIKLAGMSAQALKRVIQRVCDKEGFKLSEDVIDEIIDSSDSSARKALVILEQVAECEGEEAQIKAIQASTFNKDEAINLARALFSARGTSWNEVAAILRNLSDQDVEGIRYQILGYARSCLIGKEGKPPPMKFAAKAFKVIDIFGRNFYDSKQAGLAAACFEVINT